MRVRTRTWVRFLGQFVDSPLPRAEGLGTMGTTKPTQLGMVGLGRMGSNLVRRLMRDGHPCVAFDLDPAAVETARLEGATGVDSLAALVAALPAPRSVWLMLPAGEITERAIVELAGAGGA